MGALAMNLQVARDAADQEQLEAFILERVGGGAMLRGTYPPNDEPKAACAHRRKSQPTA